MKYASIALVALVIALLARAVYLHAKADEAIVEYLPQCVDTCAEFNEVPAHPPDWVDTFNAEVRPQLSQPVKMRQSFLINCASMDGGAATECGVPMDGGSVGKPIPASSLYVAPVVGSSVKIRVGPSDVNQNKGYEVGTSARDGVGVQADVSGCYCMSEGAAQKADVVILQ